MDLFRFYIELLRYAFVNTDSLRMARVPMVVCGSKKADYGHLCAGYPIFIGNLGVVAVPWGKPPKKEVVVSNGDWSPESGGADSGLAFLGHFTLLNPTAISSS